MSERAASRGFLAAMGAAVTGVFIGAGAVLLGVQHRALPTAIPGAAAAFDDPHGHEPGDGKDRSPATRGGTGLADAIERTRAAVVDLETEQSVGAGVIVDPSGIVVTHAQVILDALPPGGAAPRVQARLWNDRRVAVRVRVLDRAEDLAVLELVAGEPAERFTAVRLGRSEGVRVGDDVFAFGNPLGLGHSVTRGIVAARDRVDVLRRRHTPALQLDLSVHLGSAGGPVFDRTGALVGIVTASPTHAEGIAFAVPIDHVRGFLEALRQPGGAHTADLGLELDVGADLDPRVRKLGYDAGLLVRLVRANQPAQAAGLVQGDVIVALRGQRLDGVPGSEHPAMLRTHLQEIVRALFPGERLGITVIREGTIHELELVM